MDDICNNFDHGRIFGTENLPEICKLFPLTILRHRIYNNYLLSSINSLFSTFDLLKYQLNVSKLAMRDVYDVKSNIPDISLKHDILPISTTLFYPHNLFILSKNLMYWLKKSILSSNNFLISLRNFAFKFIPFRNSKKLHQNGLVHLIYSLLESTKFEIAKPILRANPLSALVKLLILFFSILLTTFIIVILIHFVSNIHFNLKRKLYIVKKRLKLRNRIKNYDGSKSFFLYKSYQPLFMLCKCCSTLSLCIDSVGTNEVCHDISSTFTILRNNYIALTSFNDYILQKFLSLFESQCFKKFLIFRKIFEIGITKKNCNSGTINNCINLPEFPNIVKNLNNSEEGKVSSEEIFECRLKNFLILNVEKKLHLSITNIFDRLIHRSCLFRRVIYVNSFQKLLFYPYCDLAISSETKFNCFNEFNEQKMKDVEENKDTNTHNNIPKSSVESFKKNKNNLSSLSYTNERVSNDKFSSFYMYKSLHSFQSISDTDIFLPKLFSLLLHNFPSLLKNSEGSKFTIESLLPLEDSDQIFHCMCPVQILLGNIINKNLSNVKKKNNDCNSNLLKYFNQNNLPNKKKKKDFNDRNYENDSQNSIVKNKNKKKKVELSSEEIKIECSDHDCNENYYNSKNKDLEGIRMNINVSNDSIKKNLIDNELDFNNNPIDEFENFMFMIREVFSSTINVEQIVEVLESKAILSNLVDKLHGKDKLYSNLMFDENTSENQIIRCSKTCCIHVMNCKCINCSGDFKCETNTNPEHNEKDDELQYFHVNFYIVCFTLCVNVLTSLLINDKIPQIDNELILLSYEHDKTGGSDMQDIFSALTICLKYLITLEDSSTKNDWEENSGAQDYSNFFSKLFSLFRFKKDCYSIIDSYFNYTTWKKSPDFSNNRFYIILNILNENRNSIYKNIQSNNLLSPYFMERSFLQFLLDLWELSVWNLTNFIFHVVNSFLQSEEVMDALSYSTCQDLLCSILIVSRSVICKAVNYGLVKESRKKCFIQCGDDLLFVDRGDMIYEPINKLYSHHSSINEKPNSNGTRQQRFNEGPLLRILSREIPKEIFFKDPFLYRFECSDAMLVMIIMVVYILLKFKFHIKDKEKIKTFKDKVGNTKKGYPIWSFFNSTDKSDILFPSESMILSDSLWIYLGFNHEK